MCLNNTDCVFAIHFYRDQYNNSNSNTENRKPLNAKENTCVLRNELNIQNGTYKDSSAIIYYLIGKIVLSMLSF